VRTIPAHILINIYVYTYGQIVQSHQNDRVRPNTTFSILLHRAVHQSCRELGFLFWGSHQTLRSCRKEVQENARRCARKDGEDWKELETTREIDTLPPKNPTSVPSRTPHATTSCRQSPTSVIVSASSSPSSSSVSSKASTSSTAPSRSFGWPSLPLPLTPAAAGECS
jgi:hypothetical protein